MFTNLTFNEGETKTLKLQVGKLRYPVAITKKGNNLWLSYGYNKSLTNEIKALEGARWHGYSENPIKQWTIKDSEHNRFQLEYLSGGNPYAHFDKPLIEVKPNRKELREHQIEMLSFGLTRHFGIFAVDMGAGKSLAAIEIMEQSGATDWIWSAPRSALYSVQLECIKWKSKVTPRFYTYEGLTKLAKEWPKGQPPPQGLILDEASRCKNPTAQRTQSSKWFADYIRDYWKDKGYVILMSGTPAPKSPVDWFSLCNIACPGFLREGDQAKFRKRLSIMKQEEGVAGVYSELVSWLDDERKCSICGKFADDFLHDVINMCEDDYHTFVPSKNEVSHLYQRMKGLVLVKLKKDCLQLPDKQYKIIRVKPTQEVINAAKLITATSTSAIKTLTLLRELSDGFQYEEEAIGTETCPLCKGSKIVKDFIYIGPDNDYDEIMRKQYEGIDIPPGMFQESTKACPNCNGTGESISYRREAKQVECKKEDVLNDLLDEHDEIGRIVIYAGFTGSVDRCVEICQRNKWNYIRCDGRGFSSDIVGTPQELLLKFQNDKSLTRFAFIAQPSSGGMGLTLTASPTIVYYSNDFNAESRQQSEDRIHRMGMDVNRGATIIDIIHLPSDELVLDNLKKKKKLQLMTLGEMNTELSKLETVTRD